MTELSTDPPPTKATKPTQTSIWSAWRFWLAVVGILVLLCAGSYPIMFAMPGQTFQGPIPTPDATQMKLATKLQRIVQHIATTIGPRNIKRYSNLHRTQKYIDKAFRQLRYPIRHIGFKIKSTEPTLHGKWAHNVEATKRGTSHPNEILVVGAHYDSAFDSPGANDNASGVAALLALAKMLAPHNTKRTIRFVAFVNEEPPYFRTNQMGSLYYARRCEGQKDNIIGMISLETIGYFSDKPNSQHYPPPLGTLYPSKGNFIGFVGNINSRSFLHRTIKSFRQHARIPSEGVATLTILPGIGWSDHWAFWQAGYKAIMITDSAPYRYPHYHTTQDTPDKLDYHRMALITQALKHTLLDLANPK